MARDGGDFAEGSLGADGFGFVVARELETKLILAGGSKLVNLPDNVDVASALSKVLALTDGWLRVGQHAEELFECSLFVATPDGGQDLLSFYAGPSGLAIGTGRQLDPTRSYTTREAYERAMTLPRLLAVALERALERGPGVDFVWSGSSDFGEHTIGVIDGSTIRGGRHAPLTPWKYPLETTEDWDRAQERASEIVRTSGAPVDAIAELIFAFTVLAPPLAKKKRGAYH
jgi:hypothetical protein